MNSAVMSEGDVLVEVQTKPLTIKVCRGNKPLLQRLSSEVDYEHSGFSGNFYDVKLKRRRKTLLP